MSGRKQIPPPPLKPAGAFFLWRNENYDELKDELLAKYGQLKGLTINKRIGNIWKKLEDKKKDKYFKQARKLQEKFEEELEDYIKIYGERSYRKQQRGRAEKSKRQSKSKQKSKSKSAKGY